MSNFVIVGFNTEYHLGKATEYVTLAPAGEAFERTHTKWRIKDVMPPENINPDSLSHQVMVARWKIIQPHYDAWKQGLDLPEDGTPLAAWAGVSPEQAALLRRMGIKTVEDVKAMSESATVKLPFPGARKLPELAADFLNGRDKASAAEEMAAMREKMAAMEELLAEAMAQEKRGPGRPKKVEAA